MKKLLFILCLLGAGAFAYYHVSNHSVEIESDITDRVTLAYGGESTPEDFEFVVDGRDVTLSGMVDNAEEKASLGAVAAQLEGVRVVNNNLTYEGEVIPVAVIEDVEIFEEPEIELAVIDDIEIEEPEIEVADVEPADVEPAAGAADVDVEVDVAADDAPKVLANSCQESLARILESEMINFDSNKATIKKSSYGTLNRIVNQAKKCEQAYINVHGYTDSTGPKDPNRRLSLARAQAVGEYLMKNDVRQGIKAYGHGESLPIASNATREGRAKNRRIEFKVQPLEN